MAYKTILVQVDASRDMDPCIMFGADIAKAEHAHLVGVVSTRMSDFLRDALPQVRNDPNIDSELMAVQRRAEQARGNFQNIAVRTGITSFETRMVDDNIASGMHLMAHCCDLVVVGQPDPTAAASLTHPTFAEHMLLESGVPCLIVPQASATEKAGTNILIAWNASIVAARAVRGALPLLRRARNVTAVVFNPASQADISPNLPGADLVRYLAHHGIEADVVTPTTDDHVGDALLEFAAASAADLLVMGGYGRSRFREAFLGGTTSTVLTTMKMPVLMAH